MKQVSRIEVNRGYGMSLENLIQAVCGEPVGSTGSFIEVEEVEPGVFEVVGNNLTDRYPDLGFSDWADEVEDLDNGHSDEASCFGMSSSLLWKDVRMSPERFEAPSLDRLREALSLVIYCAWDPGDI